MTYDAEAVYHEWTIVDRLDIAHADQDHRDGRALRRLREALPDGWSIKMGLNPLGPHWWVQVRRTWRPDDTPYLSRDGATIAGAADKCREALRS